MGGKCGVLKKPKNLNIMVVRISASGLLVNARPCYQCTLMLKSLGINKVYYSIENSIICEKVSQMISINSSNMWKVVDRIHYNAPVNIIEYYKNIIQKMPQHVKKKNADHFVRYIEREVNGCNYKFINNKLLILINNNILGELYII
jgi:hypothetical protein